MRLQRFALSLLKAAPTMLSALGASRTALAANGTWINTTSGGLWSASANWSGGTVASGVGGVANFSTLNITAIDTVHLDSARTIGGLLFADTTPTNSWILETSGNAADVLTMAVVSGAPSIAVNNEEAGIYVVVAGTQGLAKTGGGRLFWDESNTFSGGLAVLQGTLYLQTINNAGTNGTLGNNASVTLGASGQTGTLSISGTTPSSNMPFVLAAGGTGAFQLDSSGTNLTLSGAISGSGAREQNRGRQADRKRQQHVQRRRDGAARSDPGRRDQRRRQRWSIGQ